jgi:hypothetical protein
VVLAESELSSDETQVVNLVVVACGDRAPETLNLIKSALMFTQSYIQLFIITEPSLKPIFLDQVIF